MTCFLYLDIGEAIEGHSIREVSGKDRHPVNIVTNVGDIGADQYRGMRVKVINPVAQSKAQLSGFAISRT